MAPRRQNNGERIAYSLDGGGGGAEVYQQSRVTCQSVGAPRD